MAKARVESYLDQKTYSGNSQGVQFNLVNNFRWKNKTENALTGGDGGPLGANFTVTMVESIKKV